MDDEKMRRILFDFLTFEDAVINGGALYCRTVLVNLLNRNAVIFGICNNKKALNPEISKIAKENNIQIFENINNIEEIVIENTIDAFFVGITQRYNRYDLTSVSCQIYGVCHDIFDIILEKANIVNCENEIAHLKFMSANYSRLRYAKKVIAIYLRRIKATVMLKSKTNNKLIEYYGYENFNRLIKRDNFHLITDSEYSANAIKYYFGDIKNEIEVFYCPRIYRVKNETMKDFTHLRDKKYFLIMSCDRFNKNASRFFDAFDVFRQHSSEPYYAVAIGVEVKRKNVISFNDVNDTELDWLMKHCYSLIYPSLAEGFGLPPLEAMKYGKPVIAAFDTSIKEIYGDDVLYFNPFYVEDLYMQLKRLPCLYEKLSASSKLRYGLITKKQDEEAVRLIDYLLGDTK